MNDTQKIFFGILQGLLIGLIVSYIPVSEELKWWIIVVLIIISAIIYDKGIKI
jgi:hypothetical protein